MILKLGIEPRGLRISKLYINDVTGLALTSLDIFYVKVKLGSICCNWKLLKMISWGRFTANDQRFGMFVFKDLHLRVLSASVPDLYTCTYKPLFSNVFFANISQRGPSVG